MTDDAASAYQKGLRGEARARAYLCGKGMEPLCQRYHSPYGDIDLVMRDGSTLVFAEVKAREKGRAYDGTSAVNAGKQERIIRTARQYLAEHPTEQAVRFDVVELTADGIMHIPDAFQGKEW